MNKVYDINEAYLQIEKLEEQNLEMLQTLIYVLKETCSSCLGTSADSVSICYNCAASKQVKATIEKATGKDIGVVINETRLDGLKISNKAE